MGKVYVPKTLGEVFSILDCEPSAEMYAGGTDLFVRSPHKGCEGDGPLVCLEMVDELRGISERGEEIRIGACTTHSELISSRLVKDNFPVLVAAARHLGAPAVRNMGTIGGNICTASPAGDTLPPLYVLGAYVELRSRNAARRLAVREFIIGPGQTVLKRGEVLSAVGIGKDDRFNLHHFEKVGQRKAMAISVASFTFLARLGPGDIVDEARCALGSVAPTVFTSESLDGFFAGKPIDGRTLAEAAAIVRKEVSPISDVRASKQYRRVVAGNLLMRLEGASKGGR